MLAENIVISEMTSAVQCVSHIDCLESDRRNYSCTDREWNNGAPVKLKVRAQRKLHALHRKLQTFPDQEA